MKSIKTIMLLVLCMAGSSLIAKNTEDKIKDAIESAADSLKSGMHKLGDDASAIQDYFNHYHWKGVIEAKTTSGQATLSHLKMNGHSRAVVVKPGEPINGEVHCSFERDQCSSICFYRVVLGINGEGAQTTIGNTLGAIAGKSKEHFVLIAPEKPGLYQLRFRTVEKFTETEALKAWVDDHGDEPSATTTIGFIYVKS